MEQNRDLPPAEKERTPRKPLICKGFCQLPGQDSNLDKESQNPNAPQHNVNSISNLQFQDHSGCSAGRSDKQSEGGVADADLTALVAAWPALSEPIKAAIRALIGSAAHSTHEAEGKPVTVRRRH